MSGRKRAAGVTYSTGLSSEINQQINYIDTQQREAERRRDDNIKRQLDVANQRINQRIEGIQGQINLEAQKAQLERARMQEMMQQTISNVTGIEMDVEKTQQLITDLQGQVAEAEKTAAGQRQQIMAGVVRSQQLIAENRELINRNYREMKQNFDTVLNTIEKIEKKREMEKILNVTELIDQAKESMASIPGYYVAQYDPETYQEAQKNLELAAKEFSDHLFDAAQQNASNAKLQFSNLAANVEKYKREFETAREQAQKTIAQARGEAEFLTSEEIREFDFDGKKESFKMKDIVSAYYEDQAENLLIKTKAIQAELERTNNLVRFRDLTREAESIKEDAAKLRQSVFELQKLDVQRQIIMGRVIRAMEKHNETVEPYRFENPGKITSDLIVDKGKEMHIHFPLKTGGTPELTFKDQVNIQQNTKEAEQFSRIVKTEGIDIPNFQRVT